MVVLRLGLVLLVLVGSLLEIGEDAGEAARHLHVLPGTTRGRCVASWTSLSIFLEVSQVGQIGHVGLEIGAGAWGVSLTGRIECFKYHCRGNGAGFIELGDDGIEVN